MYLHIFSFNEEPKKTAPEPEKHFKCFNDHCNHRCARLHKQDHCHGFDVLIHNCEHHCGPGHRCFRCHKHATEICRCKKCELSLCRTCFDVVAMEY